MEEGQTMRVAVRDVVSNGLRDTAVEYQMAGCAKRLVQSSQIPEERLCGWLPLSPDPG